MLSDRLTQQQLALQIDLGDDVDELTTVEELQRGQSAPANHLMVPDAFLTP